MLSLGRHGILHQIVRRLVELLVEAHHPQRGQPVQHRDGQPAPVLGLAADRLHLVPPPRAHPVARPGVSHRVPHLVRPAIRLALRLPQGGLAVRLHPRLGPRGPQRAGLQPEARGPGLQARVAREGVPRALRPGLDGDAGVVLLATARLAVQRRPVRQVLEQVCGLRACVELHLQRHGLATDGRGGDQLLRVAEEQPLQLLWRRAGVEARAPGGAEAGEQPDVA
mmetsp:Transcript_23472/g.62716  ORF Transcript_23472/g.62716 Transcript_23472/m.62716 type:complete len:224 (-) Transcript_23472:717-1388(-)